jgi:hypothetical protein
MNFRRAILVATMLLSCGAALADVETAGGVDAPKALTVRTFQFKYKDAGNATAAIKPLVSSEGSVSIQPSTNSLIVTDRPENLKAIAAMLARFDTPAQTLKLRIRIVGAGRTDGSARVPDSLRDVAPKLAVLRFNSFDDLGDATAQGKEGDPAIVNVPSGYRADFRFGALDPATDSIAVGDLKLSRLEGPQKDQLTQLLKTSLNIRLGQTVILGAARDPQSQRALILVLSATH